MTTEIRELELQEAIKGLHFLSSYAFSPTPPLPDFDPYAERIRSRKGSKYFGVFDNGQLQAVSCATTPLTQNLRGKLFPMGGVANVATHPAARRKGFARMMMSRIFTEFYEQSIATSCLYPFKEAFYQRLGYVPFPQTKRVQFNPLCLSPILKMDLEVNFELVSYYDGYDNFRAFCQEVQKNTHGMALFSIPLKEAAKSHKAWLVFIKKGSEVIGAMHYTLKDQIMNQTLHADNFLFTTAEGKFALLNWIARHIDQVGKVILTLPPDQTGENFYTDIRPEYQGLFVPPMGRVINLKNPQGLTCGDGEISVTLVDQNCKWNNGTWRLVGDAGELTINRSKSPDCTLTIHGLSALVYGVTDPAEFPLRGWGNPNQKQQAILRKMFPPALPYLHTMY